MPEWMHDILAELTAGFGAVPPGVVTLRLLAALFLAGLIGFEREWHRKPAGLRTHMLVAVAACLFILISQQMVADPFKGAEANMRVDPTRLIQAVTAGVAFLAAGLIFTTKGEVHNVTTGASLWLAGAIGLACGAGEIPTAALAAVVVLAVLWLMRVVEKRMGTRR